mgnify:FL=1
MKFSKQEAIIKRRILYNYYPNLDMVITTYIKLLELDLVSLSDDPMPRKIYDLLFNHTITIPPPIMLEK